MLEHQLRQPQHPADAHTSHSAAQQQQVEQHLRQQLATTQQQLARLQEEHTQYVDRTSNLLVRLQAQMQQLMKQAPGLAAGVGEGQVVNLM
jgi:molecular chaperone GrpE (heat shock protein)